MTDSIVTPENILASLEARLAEIQSFAKTANMWEGRSVVYMPAGFITDIHENGRVVCGHIHRARLFSATAASLNARRTRDGNDTQGVSMSVADGIARDVAELQETIEWAKAAIEMRNQNKQA